MILQLTSWTVSWMVRDLELQWSSTSVYTCESSPELSACGLGFNGTIFAYGQTGPAGCNLHDAVGFCRAKG